VRRLQKAAGRFCNLKLAESAAETISGRIRPGGQLQTNDIEVLEATLKNAAASRQADNWSRHAANVRQGGVSFASSLNILGPLKLVISTNANIPRHAFLVYSVTVYNIIMT
jgi:hypothetical protein